MYALSKKLLKASSLALALATFSCGAFADSVSQEVTDARQASQIWTTYALSPALRANGLKVSVKDGTATLSGHVADGVDRDLAKQIALGVSGINNVDDQIQIEAEYSPPAPPSDRGYGQVIDDATITAEVESKLLWDKYTSGQDIDVSTVWGKVTLKGKTDSATTKALSGQLTRNTRGVVSVDNQLVVDPALVSLRNTPAKAGRDIADSWISAKVMTTFMYSSNIDSSNIAVSTHDGVVTLSGRLDSAAERELAIELTRNVRGVKLVNAQNLTL